MISREEVAKRLRVYATDFDFGDSNPIWYVEKAVFNDIRIREQGRVFSRLADLIDPTCKYLPNVHAAWFDGNDEEHEDTNLEALGHSENACCSFCGYEMMTGEEGWFDYERKEHGNRLIPLFNYCPDCGARVVRDEA
jgi:hypothetical protein